MAIIIRAGISRSIAQRRHFIGIVKNSPNFNARTSCGFGRGLGNSIDPYVFFHGPVVTKAAGKDSSRAFDSAISLYRGKSAVLRCRTNPGWNPIRSWRPVCTRFASCGGKKSLKCRRIFASTVVQISIVLLFAHVEHIPMEWCTKSSGPPNISTDLPNRFSKSFISVASAGMI